MEALLLPAVGVIALAVFFLVTQKKVYIFWTAFVATFMPFGYIERFFFDLPSIFKYFALVVASVCTVILLATTPRERTPISMSLILGVGGLMVLSALSAMFNGVNLVAYIFGNQNLVLLVLYSIILFYLAPAYTKKDFFEFITWTAVISAIVAIIQRVLFVMILKLNSGDIVTGLFENDGPFTFFQLFGILITMTYWMKNERLISLSPGLTLIILLASLAVGNNKANFIFLALICLYLIYGVGLRLFLQNFGKYLVSVLGIGIAIFFFNTLFNSFYNVERKGKATYIESITDIDFISNYYFGDNTRSTAFTPNGSLKRGAAITFSYDLINRSNFHYYLGYGPGSTSGVKIVQGRLNKRYPGFKIGKTPISFFLAEGGILGLVAYALFLILLLRIALRTSYTLEERVISVGLILLAFSFFVYDNMTFFPMYPLMLAIISYPAPMVIEEEEYFDSPMALATD